MKSRVMHQKKQLPNTLRALVSKTVSLLGDVIREQEGDDFYCVVEELRERMTRFRRLTDKGKHNLLNQVYEELGGQSRQQKRLIAHSFTLMIQVINACEIAYRSHRLKARQQDFQEVTPQNILVFVLTAHPTEARAPANIALLQQIRQCCFQLLEPVAHPDVVARLKHYLKLAWLTPVAKHRRPEVLDEAQAIFSTILRPDILDELMSLRQAGVDIRIRTWVGGDKDGHPGIDEKVMLRVMKAARTRLVRVLKNTLNAVHASLILTELPFDVLNAGLKQCRRSVKELERLDGEDGLRLKQFKADLDGLCRDYETTVGQLHPELLKINTLFTLFPALIVPLEFREDQAKIHQALEAREPTAIARMLACVGDLSRHSLLEHYVKGLVISMTQTVEDIQAGVALTDKILGRQFMRVVPLFETEAALLNAPAVLKALFDDAPTLARIRAQWDNKFEVMLGYSDSSKGMGVLASRLGIAEAMRDIDLTCQAREITSIFFHGSGGSVDRGGGSIREQTAWWPQSSFNIYKTTLQGEMVERGFASRYILKSTINKLFIEAGKPHHDSLAANEIVKQFASEVSSHYQAMLTKPKFLDVVGQATSYRLLTQLNFGSRPVKRSTDLSIDSLRAIPWVLCWTQTRVLFPTWWGVGQAFANKDSDFVASLQHAYQENALFRSFIKLLGFTLSKVDLSIWRLYLSSSSLKKTLSDGMAVIFQDEYQNACDAVKTISGQDDLCFQPWLQQSIELRSPMIHPLNLLQIHAIQDQDTYLIRETTTGIASGMLTTG